jgi:hypothetical protein
MVRVCGMRLGWDVCGVGVKGTVGKGEGDMVWSAECE